MIGESRSAEGWWSPWLRLRAALSERSGAMALAITLAVVIVLWSSVTLYTEQLRFAVFAPQVHVAVVIATVIARLFGALVLSMFITERHGDRLLWVAAGLLVSGLGALAFQSKDLVLGSDHSPNAAAYESLLVWTATATLFAAGLIPKNPPKLGRGSMLAILAAFGVAGLALHEFGDLLPPLILEANTVAEAATGALPYETTGWNQVIAIVPLALAVAATIGAASLYQRGALAGWLLVAMVLLSGSQLRAVFQPSAYSPVLTTADFLRLTCAAVIALGGILKLRRIAQEREVLLAVEKETNRRLEELGVMKADFTAMVAHELNSPLSAVRNLSDMLSTEELSNTERRRVLDEIQTQTNSLNALVEDVRTSGAVERDDFNVELRPTPLKELLDDAATFFRTLSGDRKLTITLEADEETRVLADAGRIGQVLRNLLSNAVRHSPESKSIEIRAVRVEDRVRMEVADRGCGIHPDDVARIFEKFGRGRDAAGRKVPGAGLGLYLSRRIVHRHGGDLTLKSTSGEGSVFAFELERLT